MAKPEIRLKGFEGVWKNYKLGGMGSTYSGVGFPDKEQGGVKGIPFFKVSDMNKEGNEVVMHFSNNYVTNEQIKRNGWRVCEKPSLLFAKVGAAVLLNRKRLVLKPCLCDNNTMLYCFNEEAWNSYFCLTLFQKINLASLAQTGSLPSYNGSMVENIDVLVPIDKAEQEGIANYFKSLDSMIQAATKKIASLKQMKSASLISMFPQEGETTPRVRFKGFEEEWKKVRLNELCQKVVRKSSLNSVAPIMMISASSGFINQSEKYSSDNAGKSLINYTLLYEGEIAYNHGASKIRKYGSCFVLKEKEARVPFVYHTFRMKVDDPTFFAYYLNSGILDSELRKVVSSTARMDGLLNISYETYMNLFIYKTNIEEQQRIASYFTSLDKQISLQEQRVEKLKQIKAACLDKMFV